MQRRRPRYRRDRETPPLELTDRDIAILHEVYRHRFLRTTQIVSLAEGGTQGMQRRLRRLYDKGYLDRPEATRRNGGGANHEMVYAIGDKGAAELLGCRHIRVNPGRWRDKNRQVSESHIDHELRVADVMVSIELTCRESGAIRLIRDDEILYRAPEATQDKPNPFQIGATLEDNPGKTHRTLTPDAVFGLHFTKEDEVAYFFLEVDRGTMPLRRKSLTQSSIFKKFLIYYEWWQAQGHRTAFNMDAFRVLFVGEGHERTRNMLSLNALVRKDEGWRAFLFTDAPRLLSHANVLEAPWRNGKREITTLLE